MFAPSTPDTRHGGRVLGIDPGLTRCGYAVLAQGDSGGVETISLGVVRTSPDDDVAMRLGVLQGDIEEILAEFDPVAVAVEKVFFQTNVRTAISVAQASGVVLGAAARRGCTVAQYTPSQVKDAVAGWGGADKAQVQKMVQMRLGLPTPPRPPDAADAAALALCHLAMSAALVGVGRTSGATR
jgi:crossover junction endodeoxyribonuclease RuvC